MKIYTKVGDAGYTRQASGKMVPKFDPQIQALGDLDELETWLGNVLAQLSAPNAGLAPELLQIQRNLYALQADINIKNSKRLDPQALPAMEARIDAITPTLPVIKAFILPGGQVTGANLQYARTLARRAERSVVALHTQQTIDPGILKYLNRLSDYLFTLARYANYLDGYTDIRADQK
ncbi:MAG: cob(I)yrinic acid a,c-diamide adenosyltransferase [Lactobacillus sp.]|jgi:ATP:cob(I)alamin adenosyltransferase|nr:cob(I)yrinic acid a,c-diamide adenosyltransferase [Lactobacillus sp.]